MNFFGTLFDKNYLSRGIALYHSIHKTGISFTLYVLCLDDFAFEYLESNKNLFPFCRPINLTELEQYDKDLLQCKLNRSRVEYYFTISPCLPLFLLEKFNLPHICTLDADICFYSSPSPLFEHLETHSIIITPHKFSENLIGLEKYGVFNVSFQIFKNNKTGVSCLKKWREQCLENCSDILDESKQIYADQLYLNTWPKDYPNEVIVLDDSVSGLAPWNINRFDINKNNGAYVVNGQPLIYFHFQYFKILNKYWATNGFDRYKVKSHKHLNLLYWEYWNSIEFIHRNLDIHSDDSFRINLRGNKFVTVLQERKAYLKIKNSIFVFNASWIPKIFRTLIIKKYG